MGKGGKKVTIYTCAAEHPGHFRVDDGILLCIYCNHAIKWEKKSTVNDHHWSNKGLSGKFHIPDSPIIIF